MSYQSPLDFEFIRIPLPIQNRKGDIPYSAIMLYGYLAKMHFTNVDGYIPIKNKQAAKDIKLSEKTIKEGFNILSGYGLVDSKKMGRIKGYKLMPINPEGYPEIIPDYNRPKKSKPKFLDNPEPSTSGVLNPDKDNRAPGGCSLPSTRGVLHTEHQRGAQSGILPIIEESSKESFKEMLPQGISFENYFKNLPSGIHRKIQKADVKYYWENGFKDDLIRAAGGLGKMPENEQILIFQGIINAFKRKLPMKYEQINIDQKAEYDIVWADAAKNNGDILKNIVTRF